MASAMKTGSDGPKAAGASNVPMQYVMKYLAPEALAAAIIGKGGSVIAEMRQSCQARIQLTEKNDVYPTTESRVLTTQAHSEEALNDVAKQIIAKMAELASGGSGASEAVGTEGELKLRLVVPKAAVGGLIGKEGKNIKTIREESGAKISIGDPLGQSPGADQLVLVSGPGDGVERVLAEVNKQVQLLSKQNWFAGWAGSTGSTKSPAMSAAAFGAGQPRYAMGGPPGGMGMTSPSIDPMIRVAQGLPPYVMEDTRGFAMTCVVPSRLLGGLIGRGGSGTKEVQSSTGTRISIREIPDDSDNQTLSIEGPLPNTCAAYMLMMKRYLDAEAQSAQGGGGQQPYR